MRRAYFSRVTYRPQKCSSLKCQDLSLNNPTIIALKQRLMVVEPFSALRVVRGFPLGLAGIYSDQTRTTPISFLEQTKKADLLSRLALRCSAATREASFLTQAAMSTNSSQGRERARGTTKNSRTSPMSQAHVSKIIGSILIKARAPWRCLNTPQELLAHWPGERIRVPSSFMKTTIRH